jgi:hypothetical protein
MPKKVGRALLLSAVVLSVTAFAETAPKKYRLAATSDTVQWGWLDPKEPRSSPSNPATSSRSKP